jgi:ABC-2 type transport system ATP-binding protein
VRDLLQVKDITQIQARGMTPAQLTELQEFLKRSGVQDATVTHPTTTLEDLFVRVVRDNTPGADVRIAGNGQ